jgi:uncharacterized protein with PIN domain
MSYRRVGRIGRRNTVLIQVSKVGEWLPMWKASDPELLPIARPRCRECQMRMVTAAVEEGPEGFEHRWFECPGCGHGEQNVIASDPMNTNALGWLNSDLHPPK